MKKIALLLTAVIVSIAVFAGCTHLPAILIQSRLA